MSAGVGIIGTGRALGSTIHTNEALCATTLLGTSPQWILDKTGISQRFVLADGESGSSLALLAAQRAIDSAGIIPSDIGMIVVCTFSGDYLFPPVSAQLHRDLGVKGGQIYDLQANCAGYVSAVTAVSDRMQRDPAYAMRLWWASKSSAHTLTMAISKQRSTLATVLGRLCSARSPLRGACKVRHSLLTRRTMIRSACVAAVPNFHMQYEHAIH